jgi:RNA polymerase primary sigma factor
MSKELYQSKTKRIPKEELYQYITSAQEGSEEAMDFLMRNNTPLVLKIARGFAGDNSDLMDDYAQQGYMGLMKAIQRFDVSSGYALTTYATMWIQQSIQRYREETKRTIRLPTLFMKDRQTLLKLKKKIQEETGVQPSIDELAELANIRKDRVLDLLHWQETASLDAPVKEGEEESFFIMVENEDAENPDEELAQMDMREWVMKAINYLRPREREVVKHFYGIDAEELSIKQLAEKYRLSRQSIHNILDEAMSRLRKYAIKKKLHRYIG